MWFTLHCKPNRKYHFYIAFSVSLAPLPECRTLWFNEATCKLQKMKKESRERRDAQWNLKNLLGSPPKSHDHSFNEKWQWTEIHLLRCTMCAVWWARSKRRRRHSRREDYCLYLGPYRVPWPHMWMKWTGFMHLAHLHTKLRENVLIFYALNQFLPLSLRCTGIVWCTLNNNCDTIRLNIQVRHSIAARITWDELGWSPDMWPQFIVQCVRHAHTDKTECRSNGFQLHRVEQD